MLPVNGLMKLTREGFINISSLRDENRLPNVSHAYDLDLRTLPDGRVSDTA